MTKKAKCIFCGALSTLLCDFVMGFDGKPGDLVVLAKLELHRCDAPLCENCAQHMGVTHWHGDGVGGSDSVDYCPDHPPEGNRWMHNPISADEAERLRYRHRCQAGPGLTLLKGGGQLSLFGSP